MFTVKIVTASGYEAYAVEAYKVYQDQNDLVKLHLQPRLISERNDDILIMEVKNSTIYVENYAGKTIDSIKVYDTPKN